MAHSVRRYRKEIDMIGEILTGILAWIGGMTVLITVAAVLWIRAFNKPYTKQADRPEQGGGSRDVY